VELVGHHLGVWEVAGRDRAHERRSFAEPAPEHPVDLDHAAGIARLDGVGAGAIAPGRKRGRGHGGLLRRWIDLDGASTLTTPIVIGNGPV
jgi:hypothetical protein